MARRRAGRVPWPHPAPNRPTAGQPGHPLGQPGPPRATRSRAVSLLLENLMLAGKLCLPALNFHLECERHSPVHDYVIPGLTSWMISSVGADPYSPKVRMFEMLREQLGDLTPHSHRYDFTCLVLQGEVENFIWHPDGKAGDTNSQLMCWQNMAWDGDIGALRAMPGDGNRGLGYYRVERKTYKAGEEYSMSNEGLHHIRFGMGSRVLFFEGASRGADTRILEPVSAIDSRNALLAPLGPMVVQPLSLFERKPWMFTRG
jgi:hypothetical protein